MMATPQWAVAAFTRCLRSPLVADERHPAAEPPALSGCSNRLRLDTAQPGSRLVQLDARFAHVDPVRSSAWSLSIQPAAPVNVPLTRLLGLSLASARPALSRTLGGSPHPVAPRQLIALGR